MVNIIYFKPNRGEDDDTDSVSTCSKFSSRRSDFSDEKSEWRNPSSSVYSRLRSWIRSPMLPGIIIGGALQDLQTGSYATTFSIDEWRKLTGRTQVLGESHALKPSGLPKILPIETPAISLDELSKLTGNFDQKSEVGEDSCGWVFHTILSTGEAASVRKLIPCSLQEADSDFEAQLSQVSRLKHDHIVGLLGYYLDATNRILAYQFATQGSLHDILHERQGEQGSEPGPVLTWNQRVKIAYGAARGLEYLHANGIVHQDVSSSSVLVFDDFVTKIADSNLTTQSLETSTAPLGRLLFSAPEYYVTEVLTEKSDVYNFGIVLLELVTGRKPVDLSATKGQQSLVLSASLVDKLRDCIDPKLNTEYPTKDAAKMAAIAVVCLQYEPEFRPNMKGVVKAMRSLLRR